MKILFIGGLFPSDRKNEFIKMSKGTIQFAADTFQWCFIKGLDFYSDNLTIYTAPLLGNFPKTYKKIFVEKSEFSHNSKNKDFCIGSLRIPIIGLISKTINLYKTLLKDENSNNPYILVYSLHTPYLFAAVRYKKKFPETKICLIVPDLPQYMSSNAGKLYAFLKKIDIKIINKLIESIDSFVFITDLMVSQFKVGNRPWITIEGMYDPHRRIETNDINISNEKIILYTGNLDWRYGILDLIEAFKIIPDSNYRLWICGDGNIKNQIIEYSQNDKRVKYFGQIPHEEILNLQQKASVLINPRTSNGEYTKYSFPGKTMEYIASGKPCIMHHLPGMPDEYLEHIFIPEHETSFSLYEKIIEVCNMNKVLLQEKCEKAKSFILNNKNPKSQIAKLLPILLQ